MDYNSIKASSFLSRWTIVLKHQVFKVDGLYSGGRGVEL